MYRSYDSRKTKPYGIVIGIIYVFVVVISTGPSITLAQMDFTAEAEIESASNTTTVYVPFIDESPVVYWNTRLHVRNNYVQPSTVDIYFYYPSGALHSTQSYNINANGSVTVDPPDFGIGSAKVIGTRDTSVVVLVEHAYGYYSIAAFEGIEYPGIKSVIPLVHKNNSGWFNYIFLQNTSPSGSTNVTLNFEAVTGNDWTTSYLLAPRETKYFQTSALSALGSTFVGSVEVTSDLPIAIASEQYKIYGWTSMGVGSNAPMMGTDLYAPLIQNSNSGYLSGFAAQNLLSEGSLNVKYYNSSGSSCANQSYSSPDWPVITYPIPPAGNGCPSVISAKFEGDDGKLMFTNLNQLKLNSDQASAYEPIARPTKVAVAPLIYHNTNNYITGLAIQNAGSSTATVTITYYNSNGSQVGSDSKSIGPNGFYSAFPSGSPFTGSAKISSTQPVAVVVNLLKSGSGDTLASYAAVNRPDGNVVYSTRQGFDRCAAPTINQMQTWMNYSPYRYIGIYIGGVNRSCPQVELNSNWITQTSNQGWDFVPIWVGPQPPCTVYYHKFDDDPTTAYNQGVSEATSAANAAAGLGRTGAIIYYDIEQFDPPPGDPDGCIPATKSFVSGWVAGLDTQGFKAGVYATSHNLYYYINGASNPPDAIYAADPIFGPGGWDYYPEASPYGLDYLPDNLWSGQRIRQYTGTFADAWGGLNFSIDSLVADGPITDAPTTNFLVTRLGVNVQDMDLLTESEGWILAEQKLFWTADGGKQWIDITPQDANLSHIQSVFFADVVNGWVMGLSERQFVLFTTSDGGINWQSIPFGGLPLDAHTHQSSIYLNFIDTKTGWVVFKLPTGSNFSRGLLFKTEDGGKNWSALSIPIGEPVHFATAQNGWLAGGPAGDQLFKTGDGGGTWQPVTIPVQTAENTFLHYGSPIFTEGGGVLVPVLIEGDGQNEVWVYATEDGGNSWVPMGNLTAIPAPVLDDLSTATVEWLNNQDATALFLHYDGVRQLDFVTSKTGLAYTSNGLCIENECNIERHLIITHDSGQTWTEINLP